MFTRCLILGCSQSKITEKKPIPAIERYDGPTFRVVRKFLREADTKLKDVDIYILSAQYGLISANKCISDYDQKMTRARAIELNLTLLTDLQALFGMGYLEVFLSLSKIYLQAIDGFEKILPENMSLIISQSSEGKRLIELKQYLYKSSFDEPKTRYQVQVTGQATLKGISIKIKPEEALQIASEALNHGVGDPYNFQKWYALVDSKEVSTKWFVSILSGLSVSEFQASDARRVLGQLGITVYHHEH